LSLIKIELGAMNDNMCSIKLCKSIQYILFLSFSHHKDWK